MTKGPVARRGGARFAFLVVACALALTATREAGAITPVGDGALEVSGIEVSTYPDVSAIVTAPAALVGSDIAPKRFSVTENGASRKLTVERLPNDELEVLLVIDTSGSMKGAALEAAKGAAVSFTEALPPSVRLSVAGFGTTPTFLTAFTTDRRPVAAAIGALEARGETALYDAVVASTQRFTPSSTTRRVVVLLADGGDTASAKTLVDATGALTTSKASVFAISLVTPESDVGALRALADAGKGRVVAATDTRALQSVFEQVASEVVNQYRVSWQSTARGAATLVFAVAGDNQIFRAERPVGYPSGSLSTGPPLPPPLPPKPTAVVAPSSSSERLLWIGLGSMFGAMLILGIIVLWPTRPVRRLAREMLPSFRRKPELTQVSKRAVELGDRVLRRLSLLERLARSIERAGLNVGPAEAFVFGLALAAIAFLGGLALQGILAAVLMAALVSLALVAVLSSLGDRRCGNFGDQLENTLMLMSNSLKAGYGMNQAIDTVARESMSPTADEFRRVVFESQLGKDHVAALREAATRVENEDLKWVVDAIEINREVGGNLTEVFSNIVETIRERQRLRRQVRALSAEGRVSAVILVVLPIGLFLWMMRVNRDYVDELLHSNIGHLLLLGSVGLLIVGGLWMRRIVNVKF